MYYRQFLPHSALRQGIESYWVLHPAGFPATQTMIPGGRVELIFCLGNTLQWQIGNDPAPWYRGAVLVGQRDRVSFTRLQGSGPILGLRFKPGGLAFFASIHPDKMLNTVLPARQVFGEGITALHASLYQPADEEELLQRLDLYMLNRLKAPEQQGLAALQLLENIRTADHHTVSTLCASQGARYKSLERLFSRQVGYSPKTYLRLLRFNRCIRKLPGRHENLAGLAYESGYADQSHFIRDFRHFAATTPGRFGRNGYEISSLLITHQAV